MSYKEQDDLYSQKVRAGKRKYFFDVKSTKNGDKFITISESRKLFNNNTGAFYFDRNKMFLYKEDFEKFQTALQNAIHYIDTGEMIVSPDDTDEFSSQESRGEYHNDDIDDKATDKDYDPDFGGDINDIHINEI
jgi:hypothetical protein